MAVAGEPGERPSGTRYLLGCWLLVVGYFAGGMMAAAVAKLVGILKRCAPPEGLPACDVERYMQVGTVVGAITLPAMTLWLMWRSGRDTRQRG